MTRIEPIFADRPAAEKPPLVVAVDDGYAQIKVCVPSSDGHSAPTIREFGTAITSRLNVVTETDGTVTSTWAADGDHFTVTDAVRGDNTATDDFHWSAMDRVLVNNALCECGLSGVEIDQLIVGLPMGQFFAHDGKVSGNVQRKIANLLRPVTPIGRTKPPAIIKSVRVQPQGMSAIFDYMTDFDLKRVNDMPKRVAVIDIGGRTTDLAYVIGMRQIQTANSDSLRIGVLDVREMVNAEIRSVHGLSADLPPDLLDMAIRQKRIPFRGQQCDVSGIVAQCVRSLAGTLRREIAAQLGNIDIVDKILLVGGGAMVFADEMRSAYPGAVIPDQPSWANVRGFWKQGVLAARSGR